MKFIIQRVQQASVDVQGETIGSIDKGLMVLVGIKKGDTSEDADWMINKLLQMRIFEDKEGKMNDSVTDVGGGILLIPNFTLYADASSGNRPGFSKAESPGKARELYQYLVEHTNNKMPLTVHSGEFGAYMDVSLINDGPVTIILESQ